MIVIIDVINREQRKEAINIPKMISNRLTGDETNRSNELSRVSIGKTTGLIAVDVKNDVIATIPIKI